MGLVTAGAAWHCFGVMRILPGPVVAALLVLATLAPAQAQSVAKSYEDRLLRLAEILGAVHHLREICGADEGQLWREQMNSILERESPATQLRARMVAAFNNSYRSYQRTYGACTGSAKTAAERFFDEGAGITRGLSNEIASSNPADSIDEAESGDR